MGETMDSDATAMRELRAKRSRVLDFIDAEIAKAIQVGLTGSIDIKVNFVGGRQQETVCCTTTQFVDA